MRDAERFASISHPLLATLPSAVFLYAVAYAFQDMSAGFIKAGPLFIPLLLACGLLASMFNSIIRKERTTTAPKIASAFLVALLTYSGASILIAFDPADFLRPRAANLFPAALAMTQWLLSTSLQNCLRGRELYLEALDTIEEKDLVLESRESGALLAEAFANLRWLRTLLAALPVFTFAVNFAEFRSGFAFSTETLVASLLCYLLYPMARFVVAQYIREQQMASHGIWPDPTLRSTRFRMALAVFLGCALFAGAMSSDQSILPSRLADQILALPATLLPKPQERAKTLAPIPRPKGEEEGKEAPGGSGPEMPYLDLNPAMDGLRIVVIGLGAAFFCFFVIGPLVSKRLRAYLKERSIIGFLGKKLRAILDLLLGRGRKKDKGSKLDSADAYRIRRMLESLGRKGRSAEKKQEIGRLVKSFLKLIAWGHPKGYRYGASTAPLEYGQSIAQGIPALGPQAIAAGEIIEEALFSAELLPEPRISLYESSIKAILSYKAPSPRS